MFPISKKSSYHKHYHPEEIKGLCVVKREGETTEELYKRFRKKYSKSGLAKELRDRMYYEKPSVKKRKKRLQAIRMKQREEEKARALKEKLRKIRIKKTKQRAKAKKKGAKNYDKSSFRKNTSRIPQKRNDKRGDHSPRPSAG